MMINATDLMITYVYSIMSEDELRNAIFINDTFNGLYGTLTVHDEFASYIKKFVIRKLHNQCFGPPWFILEDVLYSVDWFEVAADIVLSGKYIEVN